MRGSIRIAVAAVAVALVAAACGSSTKSTSGSTPAASATTPAATSSPTSTSNSVPQTSTSAFEACMVTDTGGIDDRSFNASSYQGLEEAHAAMPSKIGSTYLSSTSESDYTPNINTFIGRKCGIIVTVGFLMGTATQTAATKNPKQKFAIVDYTYPKVLHNVDALLFDTAQDAFLGGYLAAGMSKTHVVATFGGQKLPTVTIYMDGFWDGVQYYNSQHHANVKVLGWNEKAQTGSFTGDFTNQTKGLTTTQTFISSGADVIFPVAGNVGLGAAKAVQEADASAGSQKVNMEWVDTDGCISAPQYCKYFITSVQKGIQVAVRHAVLSAQNGTFKGGNYIGTLANGGVALAPFHQFASKVPAALQAELTRIKADIISGKIKVATKSPV